MERLPQTLRMGEGICVAKMHKVRLFCLHAYISMTINKDYREIQRSNTSETFLKMASRNTNTDQGKQQLCHVLF